MHFPRHWSFWHHQRETSSIKRSEPDGESERREGRELKLEQERAQNRRTDERQETDREDLEEKDKRETKTDKVCRKFETGERQGERLQRESFQRERERDKERQTERETETETETETKRQRQRETERTLSSFLGRSLPRAVFCKSLALQERLEKALSDQLRQESRKTGKNG